MKKTKFFLPVILLIMSSCIPIVKWKYGITNPKEETPSSLLKFLKKMDQPPKDFYIFRDSTAYCRYLNDPVFKKNLIGSLFFSEEGLLLDVKDTAKCQWSVSSFIQNLEQSGSFRFDSACRYQEILPFLLPLTGLYDTASQEAVYDYTVIITWAKFAGKLNQRLFNAADLVKDIKYKSVRLIFINIDMQKSWVLRKDQKMILQ